MPILAGLGPFGPWELALILLIVVLIFGVGRLPEVGGAVGKGIREFRKSTRDESAGDDTPPSDTVSSTTAVDDAPGPIASGSDKAFCTECGTANARGAKYCSQCGHAMTAGVS
ncbi:MAG: twin-arginine translocase TatA/TatE family subunit [Dehalococcoidia bacterium]